MIDILMRIVISKYTVQKRCIVNISCHHENTFELRIYFLKENLIKRTTINVCFHFHHQIFINENFLRLNICSSTSLHKMCTQSGPQRSIVIGKVKVAKAFLCKNSKMIHILVFIFNSVWEAFFYKLCTQERI